MSSDYFQPYMDGFYTPKAFHRVYEHVKRTSDEKVMVVRSWHNRAHALLSSARRAQPKNVSSASHSSSLLSSAIHSSSLLSSARRAQLCEKRSARPEELSSARRAQLCTKRLARSEELSSTKEVSSALRKMSAHPGELSSEEKRSAQLCARGQLIQESSALTKEVSSALPKRSGHQGELSSAQRGQFGQKSSSTAHPPRPFRVNRP